MGKSMLKMKKTPVLGHENPVIFSDFPDRMEVCNLGGGRFPVIVRYHVHPERLLSEPGTRPAKYQKSISRLQNSDCAEYLFCAKLY
jgi:hypothetical protein